MKRSSHRSCKRNRQQALEKNKIKTSKRSATYIGVEVIFQRVHDDPHPLSYRLLVRANNTSHNIFRQIESQKEQSPHQVFSVQAWNCGWTQSKQTPKHCANRGCHAESTPKSVVAAPSFRQVQHCRATSKDGKAKVEKEGIVVQGFVVFVCRQSTTRWKKERKGTKN